MLRKCTQCKYLVWIPNYLDSTQQINIAFNHFFYDKMKGALDDYHKI